MCCESAYVMVTFLIITQPGVECGGKVTYSTTQVCGLRGASVVLPCRYEYSGVGHYERGEWYRVDIGSGANHKRVKVQSNSNYPDCSRNITNLSDRHIGVYHFQFYTALYRSWITGESGITVSVAADLTVKETGALRNQSGTEVTCSASCDLGSNHQYVWYKNGETIQDQTTVSMVVSERANYSCALRDREALRSPAVCVLCGYSVSYSTSQVCGLKGAPVALPCTYERRRLDGFAIGEWYEERRGIVREHDDSNYPDCSLEIDKLSDENAGVYHFRFHTVQHQDWVTGGSGITLLVTALQVLRNNESVTKGDRLTLTCNTTCSLSNNPTFTWYKNGQPLTSNHTTRDNTLQLNPVSSDDSGSYYCAVGGHESLFSPAVILNVRSHDSGSSSMALPMSAVIAIVITLVVLMILAAVCLRRKRADVRGEGDANDNIYQNVIHSRRQIPQTNMEFKVHRMTS